MTRGEVTLGAQLHYLLEFIHTVHNLLLCYSERLGKAVKHMNYVVDGTVSVIGTQLKLLFYLYLIRYMIDEKQTDRGQLMEGWG